jgi:hypothetical protein
MSCMEAASTDGAQADDGTGIAQAEERCLAAVVSVPHECVR